MLLSVGAVRDFKEARALLEKHAQPREGIGLKQRQRHVLAHRRSAQQLQRVARLAVCAQIAARVFSPLLLRSSCDQRTLLTAPPPKAPLGTSSAARSSSASEERAAGGR